jgi:Oxidation resistance protein
MKKDRKTLCKSVLDQAILESDIEVFAWTGANYLTQLCTDDKIALGGGGTNGGEGGFGLLIEANLLIGQTSRCATFGNPPLSNEHQDGSSFEIVNLEIWTMTPCNNEEDAQKLELGKLFLEANRVNH